MGRNQVAVDANTGKELWNVNIDSGGRGILTGAPALWGDTLYVPLSSFEEGVAGLAAYECCKQRGAVAAIDTATGKIKWKSYAIPTAPAPFKKNAAGTQMYGPAGGGDLVVADHRSQARRALRRHRRQLHRRRGALFRRRRGDGPEDRQDQMGAPDDRAGPLPGRLPAAAAGRQLPDAQRPGLRLRLLADPEAPEGRQGHAAGRPEVGAGLWPRSRRRQDHLADPHRQGQRAGRRRVGHGGGQRQPLRRHRRPRACRRSRRCG